MKNIALSSIEVLSSSVSPFISPTMHNAYKLSSMFISKQISPFFLSSSSTESLKVYSTVFSKIYSHMSAVCFENYNFIVMRSALTSSSSFTNTVFINISAYNYGGAIYCVSSGIIISIDTCSFCRCFSQLGGGALWITSLSSISIAKTCYQNCSSYYTGCVSICEVTALQINLTSEYGTLAFYNSQRLCSLYGGNTASTFQNNNQSCCQCNGATTYGTLLWFYPFPSVAGGISFNTLAKGSADTIFGFNIESATVSMYYFNLVSNSISTNGGFCSLSSANSGSAAFYGIVSSETIPNNLYALCSGSTAFSISLTNCLFTDTNSSIFDGLPTYGCVFGTQNIVTYNIAKMDRGYANCDFSRSGQFSCLTISKRLFYPISSSLLILIADSNIF